MKIALVYDRVNKWGGAERVLTALHEVFPQAPLYTSIYDSNKAPWAKIFDVRPSFLQKLPLPKDKHELFPFLMGPAFETFNFDEFDVVLSVTHEFAKAVITKPKTLHICLCLNPVGYLWENHENYFSSKSWLFRFFAKPVVTYLRFYDKIVCARPDEYLAISQAVSERIQKYYDRESKVIYPSTVETKTVGKTSEEFFLIVARLVPNKRIDLAVEAFNHLGLPLKIVGEGKEIKRLKSLAKENIEFLGHLTDEEIADYYRRCTALIVPAEEDFGIVAIEAQSFGKPVIALARGGSLETIVHGKTGYLYEENSVSGLESAVREFEKIKFSSQDCLDQAKKFSKDAFQQQIKKYIDDALICWRAKQDV